MGRAIRYHGFMRRGWKKFPYDPAVAEWASSVLPAARLSVAASENDKWRHCQGTWFVGVDALPNAADGSVSDSGPLPRMASETAAAMGLPDAGWHRAQISVVYPGYPRPREGESGSAFEFRRNRDAAHVDGLHPVGAGRRRMLRETHAFILGFPLTESEPGASPAVVWEGSHELIRAALASVLEAHPEEVWEDVDLTDAYRSVRRAVFRRCRRVRLHASPGEALLVHRLALHGISPWDCGANSSGDGRMIAYFRPQFKSPGRWIRLP